MISVEEAQARIFALKPPVGTERLPLAEAAGRWAAEDVVASEGAPRSVVDAFEDLTDAIFASRDWGVDDNAGGQVEVTMTAAGCRIVVECPETELVVDEVIDVV